MTRNAPAAAILLVTTVLAPGCSQVGGEVKVQPPIVIQLNEVGEMIRAARKPPAKTADLAKAGDFYKAGYDAVKAGEIVVVWNAKMAGEGEMNSPTGPRGVIAYEKKTPTEGGYVLLQNGKVESMTADAFKAAPKAA